MKSYLKFIIILITGLFIGSELAYSQTDKDYRMMQKRAAEKVAQMNDYISFMGSKKKSVSTRKRYSERALKLFIGEGYEYEENGIEKEGVLMEVTSVNRKRPNHPLVRTYFNNLINLRYSDVKITSTEIAKIKVSDLRQIDADTYVCTCQYDQAFVGYRDGVPSYKDITTKRVKCYIKVEETEDGPEYIIKLGDITALHTERA